MGSISKRVSGAWVSDDYGIMKTATDTITTLPAVLYPNDTTATVGLKGQAVQSGTPTPDSPVMPQGTGERTENLAPPDWAEDFVQRINNSAQAYINNDILRIYASAGYEEYDIKYIFKAEWKENTRYTFNLTYRRDSIYTNAPMLQITYTDGTATQFPRAINDGEWHTIYVTSEVGKTIKYLNVWYSSNWLEIKIDSFFVYEGTAKKPFEPYGIKIPISSAGQTTSIYLSEVESTRRIKKIEVEIERVITLGSGNKGGVTKAFSGGNAKSGLGLCDRALYGGLSAVGGFYINRDNSVFVGSPTDTLDDFKSKYDGASLWYVLATEETGIVNEPLMRIGDYADTVSGISIPVTAGGDTLSVGATVQPSEVTVNYKGWHPVADVHERDNGAWT